MVVANELAGGILLQEPYPTEAYEETLLQVPSRFLNRTYFSSAQVPTR
jgi:hypothetical protein